jgi:hypothetical protein
LSIASTWKLRECLTILTLNTLYCIVFWPKLLIIEIWWDCEAKDLGTNSYWNEKDNAKLLEQNKIYPAQQSTIIGVSFPLMLGPFDAKSFPAPSPLAHFTFSTSEEMYQYTSPYWSNSISIGIWKVSHLYLLLFIFTSFFFSIWNSTYLFVVHYLYEFTT